MKSFARVVVDLLAIKDIDYGDIRIVQKRGEYIHINNGILQGVDQEDSIGIGVRILKNGAWGFAATNDLSAVAAEKLIDKAYSMAIASSIMGPGIELSEEEVKSGSYKSLVQKDPAKVPLSDKIDMLFKIDGILKAGKHVINRSLGLHWTREYKIFASTEGALQEQDKYVVGTSMQVRAAKDGDVQTRSFDNTLQGGFEKIEEMKLEKKAEQLVLDVERLLTAPYAPEGDTDLVIGSQQMVLQVHESVGHAVELDRIFGYEISYAGGSFVKPEMIDNFKYGSPVMNITQDATIKDSIGSFGYDDEGIEAKREYIVKEGILRGVLSSRETAKRIGRKSSGAARAEGFNHIPIVRMTTVSIEPGEDSLEEIIGRVKDGLYIDFNRSWSIDDRRLSFQFGTEIGYKIKNGKLGEIVKNPVYYDITPQFWSKLEAVANKNHWQMWGVPNCGKGEPGQTMIVAHGTAPALFRKVKVGHSG